MLIPVFFYAHRHSKEIFSGRGRGSARGANYEEVYDHYFYGPHIECSPGKAVIRLIWHSGYLGARSIGWKKEAW